MGWLNCTLHPLPHSTYAFYHNNLLFLIFSLLLLESRRRFVLLVVSEKVSCVSRINTHRCRWSRKTENVAVIGVKCEFFLFRFFLFLHAGAYRNNKNSRNEYSITKELSRKRKKTVKIFLSCCELHNVFRVSVLLFLGCFLALSLPVWTEKAEIKKPQRWKNMVTILTEKFSVWIFAFP